MFDIEFFQAAHVLKQKLKATRDFVSSSVVKALFEGWRNEHVPIVYNIETTNACNMKCKMCPRTTMMTRPIETMSMHLFKRIVEQLKPWTPWQEERWDSFVEDEYGIDPNEMSENHFYMYIIPKVIQLHGYGAPLLDKHMADRIWCLRQHSLRSYFSCNPANINVSKFDRMMAAGLDYVKFSIESVDNERHKEIRGPASNFSQAFDKIMELLDLIADHNYRTTIIITMLDLGAEGQAAEYEKLREAFDSHDVYIYLKSQDQHWYDGSKQVTGSIHWSEICHHPWSSMSIKSNGEVAMCMEDFNNEIILGDANKQTLLGIWNGPKYQRFRNQHIAGGAEGLKCSDQCDMKLVGNCFGQLVYGESNAT